MFPSEFYHILGMDSTFIRIFIMVHFLGITIILTNYLNFYNLSLRNRKIILQWKSVKLRSMKDYFVLWIFWFYGL